MISPDTDVYHIGLPLQARLLRSKEIVVQISAINSHDLRLLRLNSLLSALRNDPDLANINPRLLPQVLQTLYVTSGCDYISFFSGIGKATFLQYFVQHASFISGNQQHAKGTLADVSLHDGSFKLGFLAFLRLIGVIYFKKHATGFNTATPVAHYLQFLEPNSTCQQQQHTTWLDDIRHNIWDRISFENEMIPSTDALWRHWSRACWVIHMWNQADAHTMHLKPMVDFGWKQENGNLTIDWDSTSNFAAIKQRVAALTQGRKCMTGCSTARCGCRKKGSQCSEGCLCVNCVNLPASTPADTEMEAVILEEAVETRDEENSNVMDTDELMEWVFGEDEAISNAQSDEEDS